MNPLISELSALFASVEATKGTAETVDATDGVFNMWDVDIRETTPFIQRQQQGTANKLPGVPGAMMGTATFRTELVGSGATGGVPAWATTFLPSCGFDQSSSVFTRTLDTSAQETVTIAHYKNGTRQVLSGAVGTFRIVARNGAPADIIFNFIGKYVEESDTAIVNPTEPTVIPPRGYEAFTIDSADITAPEVTIESGGQTLLIEGKNDSSNTGYLHGVITSYNSTLVTEPYAQLNSVKNWRSKFATSVENALSLVVGDSANNTITIAASKLQLNASPAHGVRVGAYTRQLAFDINDGFTITFS